ncbi:MAG: hypothetical protein JXR40_09310 [Pontiellaceae bacterium]|nr:hypothetical protein [Pontiellaceae bacterium]
MLYHHPKKKTNFEIATYVFIILAAILLIAVLAYGTYLSNNLSGGKAGSAPKQDRENPLLIK